MTTPIHPSKGSVPTWTAQTVGMNRDILDRMERAVAKVRERLLRATAALNQTGTPYAVVGGNAVAAWVATVDEAAVRNTSDVDLLVRRVDLDAIRAALGAAGFVSRHAASLDMFLDGPGGKARDGVHLIFEGEMVKPGEALPNPAVADSEAGGEYRVLSLRALVQIKLTAYRRKDQVHIQDLLEVGLIDESWLAYYPAELADRLRALIETPGG